VRTLAEALLYVVAAFTGGVICSGCVTTSDLRELAAELEETDLEVADLVSGRGPSRTLRGRGRSLWGPP
jgi:outer membrane murein-binding lipoprotein Lpp